MPTVTGILSFRKYLITKAVDRLSLPAQHSTAPHDPTEIRQTGGISATSPVSRSTFEAGTYQIQTLGKGK